ncbi:synaptotagmin-like protein 4 isoform X3 [Corythoichthys intestinalis]|uniref:synaptotagmin-like protein 4 isoform X3 n=1 Tax=Corythoichthys intestinalis TaxID=161448 RepID=UPI0025A4EA23|nr:synaptotagmin-like protein 4 isoform X3 [Corythoichthys intestinalis]
MPQPIDNIDLEFLSDTERDLILEVLRRDEELRQAEEQRIRKLKTELLEIKRKGAKRGSQRYSQRSCARCHGSLSLLAFSSNQCSHCRHLVCGKCRTSLADGSWLCTVCFKESDLRKSTGDWFYNLRVNRFSTTPGHELVRSSLRKRPPLKNYVTMGDVLLKQSESSRGPPVPVPRQKVGAIGNRPSSENSGSLNSLASFETKDGPLSEYSGSIASTSSYERKGIDGLFKPSQSDTESAEIFSLTSSKTGTESGRVTPDLSKRAILPPNYNQSSGTLLPDAVSEIKQAAPSQEFDVDKLFKKSVKRVQNSPDVVNSGPDGCDQPDSSEFSGDTKVPEIKQVIPNPQFDVDKQFEKRVEHIENPPEDVKYELDVCDQSNTYESLMDFKSQVFNSQVLEIKQATPNLEFDIEKLKEGIKNIEKPPEYVNDELDVYDQYPLYESLNDIKSQFDQGFDTQVPEIKRAIPNPEFDLDIKSIKNIENPEYVNLELDVCDESHTYESLYDIKSQLVQGLDTQVPEIDQTSPNPEFRVETNVQPVESSPECVNYGLDVCVQSSTYVSQEEIESTIIQGLVRQVPEIKRAVPNPEFDLDIKSVKNIENPEYANLELDVCDESHTYESLYEIKSQLVQGLDTQVPEIDQTIPNPEFRVETNVQPVESPPECLNYGLDVCIQSSTYVSQEEIESTIIQGLDRQVSEKNQVSASPQFDVDELYTKCVKHVEEPPESVKHGLDSCDQTVTHAVPVAVKRQFPQGSDMQVPEIKQASPQPEFNVEQECIKNIENPPECVKYEPDVCDRPGSFKRPVPAKRHFLQGLETQVPDIKHVCPSPELDAKKLFKRSVTRTQNPPEHQSALDLHENRDTLVIPMGNRSQSVPDLEMQEAEEEDIDSLVDNHLSAMASSSSRSTSMTSIYSGSGDNFSLDIRGEVIFTMYYDDDNQSLQVLIKECRKLTFGDTVRQTTNPYVKCYLLPDKSRQSKRKTTIKRHTCDPVYEETFKYSIRRNQLLTRSMLISVWHHGHLSSNPFLGEVEIALDCYDLDSRMEECMALMTKAPCCIPATAFNQFKGELVISLKYVTPKGPQMQKTKSFSLIPPGKKVVEVAGGELHVLIKEAKNLIAMKGTGGTSDSFVKGYLFPSKSKTNKRKTPVVKKNLNPHYGHTFVYKELTLDQLKTMCLELTVWDKEPMLSNEFLGGVRLSSGEGSVKIGNNNVGMDSVGEEVSLWQKMMQYPDSWAEGSLPLRTTMRKKKDK